MAPRSLPNGNMDGSMDAAVTMALGGVWHNQTPKPKIRTDGSMDAAVSTALGGVWHSQTPNFKIGRMPILKSLSPSLLSRNPNQQGIAPAFKSVKIPNVYYAAAA